MDRWVGKVAIVTGASSGIGEAIARKLVQEGVKVVGLGRRKDRLDAISNALTGEKGQFYGYQADLTKEEDIIKAFEWTKWNIGPLHILVNNAGFYKNALIAEVNTEDAKSMFDINVLGMIVASREALRLFKENKTIGHIINVNSVVGHSVIDYPGLAIYTSSKYAVTAFTESLRLEINRSKLGIKVTGINPGLVETELFNENVYNYLKQSPHYAALKPEDITNALIFILSTPIHCQIDELTLTPIYAKD